MAVGRQRAEHESTDRSLLHDLAAGQVELEQLAEVVGHVDVLADAHRAAEEPVAERRRPELGARIGIEAVELAIVAGPQDQPGVQHAVGGVAEATGATPGGILERLGQRVRGVLAERATQVHAALRQERLRDRRVPDDRLVVNKAPYERRQVVVGEGFEPLVDPGEVAHVGILAFGIEERGLSLAAREGTVQFDLAHGAVPLDRVDEHELHERRLDRRKLHEPEDLRVVADACQQPVLARLGIDPVDVEVRCDLVGATLVEIDRQHRDPARLAERQRNREFGALAAEGLDVPVVRRVVEPAVLHPGIFDEIERAGVQRGDEHSADRLLPQVADRVVLLRIERIFEDDRRDRVERLAEHVVDAREPDLTQADPIDETPPWRRRREADRQRAALLAILKGHAGEPPLRVGR